MPTDFLEAIGVTAAAAFTARAVVRMFDSGEALLHAGQVPREVFLLRDGRVKVSAVTTSGREFLLDFRGPGEVVGELSALDERPRSATVVALERVETQIVSHEQFRACIMGDLDAASAMLRVLAARLRDADAKRIQLAGYPSLQRVAFCLLELADRFGEANETAVDILLPISQEELAGWAGSSVESVARALATMRGLGWVETRRRAIRVLNRTALERATE